MTPDARPPAAPHDAGPAAAPHDARPLRRLLVILDYDGTATTRECNEVVLQAFVGDAWRPFEDEVRAGRLSHAACFARQIGLVRASRTELRGAMVAAAEPAPGLAAFLAAVRDGGGRAALVSAGFREAIEEVWRRHDLPPLEIVASELVGGGLAGEAGAAGRPPYRVAFSPRLGDCPRCGPAACKAAVLRALRRPGDTVWVFGDGASDLCPAREADLVFARGHLADACAAESLPWRPLDFRVARRVLAEVAA